MQRIAKIVLEVSVIESHSTRYRIMDHVRDSEAQYPSLPVPGTE
jgi:hypothetical protein